MGVVGDQSSCRQSIVELHALCVHLGRRIRHRDFVTESHELYGPFVGDQSSPGEPHALRDHLVCRIKHCNYVACCQECCGKSIQLLTEHRQTACDALPAEYGCMPVLYT